MQPRTTTWRWEEGAGGIRTLWFDQPGTPENVLDRSALDELEARLVEVENDSSARGLVISSAKPAGFCAGADLQKILSLPHARRSAEASSVTVWRVLDHLSAAGGADCRRHPWMRAWAGGSSWRSRAGGAWPWPRPPRSRLGMPEVHFGLIPALGGNHAVPRSIGPDDGLNLLITGRTIGYLLARSHGFVDRLASEGDSIESLDLLSAPIRQPNGPGPRKTGKRPGIAPAKQIDEQPGEHPRPSFRSSRSSRSTLPTAARPPAKPPSKPWPRWPCRKTSATALAAVLRARR